MSAAYRWGVLAFAAIATSVPTACTTILEPRSGGVQPTPSPTIPHTVLGVCLGSSAEIQRLDGQFHASAATTDLVAQGTIMATLTGVISTDLNRIQSVAPTTGDLTLLERWLAALQAVVDEGVAAVRASSDRDVSRFQESAAEMQRRRAAARELANSLGYGSCPY